MGGKWGMEKGNFNDEVMRHPAEHGEPSVLQPALTTSFSHAFRIDLVRIINVNIKEITLALHFRALSQVPLEKILCALKPVSN